MRCVIDANVAVQACLEAEGLDLLARHDLVAPPIFASETLSALHEMRYRGEISDDLAVTALRRRSDLAFEVLAPDELWQAAWRLATQLGWAKTYDAEYVALAQMLHVPLVTLDAKLARGVTSLVSVIGPADL